MRWWPLRPEGAIWVGTVGATESVPLWLASSPAYFLGYTVTWLDVDSSGTALKKTNSHCSSMPEHQATYPPMKTGVDHWAKKRLYPFTRWQ